MVSKRQSNFELLRILCMVSIIAGHVLTQTDAARLCPTDGIDYFLLLFLSNGLWLMINCFVMTGAWFLVDVKFQAKRVVNLWLEILFYSVILDSFCLIANVGDASIIWEIQAFFPIMGRPIWFGAEYICMLLLSPFMNKLLRVNQTVSKKLLILIGCGIVICATIFPIDHTAPVFSELLWFCFLYMMIGYIKTYQVYIIKNRKWYWVGAAGGWILLLGIRLLGDTTGNDFVSSIASYYFIHYESLIGLICSYCLFAVFRDVNMGVRPWINWLSASVFAVYLIHQTWVFYPFLWNGIYHVNDYALSGYFSLYLMFIEATLFAVCGLIDTARRWLFAKTIYQWKI